MISYNKLARLSGLVYLMVVVTGIFTLMYIPSKLIVGGDAAATVANIRGSEFLFRLGIVSGLNEGIFFLILPLVLYQLLKLVNKNYAVLMVIFSVISVPIGFINILNLVNVLSLLSGADYLHANSAVQLQGEVMFFINSYNNGLLIQEIFWGLWLFPFGYLVFKSGFLPRLLGVFLMLGCFSYLVDFFARLLFSINDLPDFIMWPASIGEIGICLWLLLVGVKEKQTNIS